MHRHLMAGLWFMLAGIIWVGVEASRSMAVQEGFVRQEDLVTPWIPIVLIILAVFFGTKSWRSK